MNQKGFTGVFFIFSVLLASVGIIAGTYYLKTLVNSKPKSQNPVMISQTPQLTPTPSPVNKTANLKTFTLENITFKYPTDWNDPEYIKTTFGQSAEIKKQDGSERIVVLSGVNKGYTEQKLSQFINSLIADGGERLTLGGSEAVKIKSISKGTKVITIYVTSRDKASQYSISLEASQTYSDQEVDEILSQIVSTFKSTQ